MRWGKNDVPEDIDPAEAEEIVESIARSKAARYRRIAHLGVEDIAQEVRIKLWKSLSKFDSSRKVKLRTFLTVCAENRIRDIRRSLLYKHNKPCFRCPLWDKAAAKAGLHDCKGFQNKLDCDKYARHERYVHTKLSANNPISLDDTRIEESRHDGYVSSLDILEHIYANLPSGLHTLFEKLKNSNYDFSALRARERATLQEALRDAMEGYEE